MNTNIVCVNLGASRQSFDLRFNAAVELLEESYPSENSVTFDSPRVKIYNRNVAETAWTEPSYREIDGTVYSFSQPPLPIYEELGGKDYWNVISRICDSGHYEELLAGHFGVVADVEAVTVWTDYLGLGRCFYIQNDQYFAASNHIGALTKFATEPLVVDEEALAQFATVGYYFHDYSPVKQIKHLARSECIRIPKNGKPTKRTYFDFGDLVRPQSQAIGTSEVVAQLRTLARNTDRLSKDTVRVALSGGKDSRMTTAIWLSAGCDAKVHTIGTLEEEARIASGLMEVFSPINSNQRISYDITHGSTTTDLIPFEERLRNAFLMWDGDNNPKTLSQKTPLGPTPKRVGVGGAVGGICHGYFYQRPELMRKMSAMDDPLDDVARRLSNRAVSPLSLIHISEPTRRS